MRSTFNLLLIFLGLITTLNSKAQAPVNDNCNTAQFITLSESGNACINASNLNATSDGIFNGCDAGAVLPLPSGGHEIWYSYAAAGIVNSITVTPIGASSAQQLSITVTNGNCAIGGTTICNTAVNPNDPASVVFTQTPGTQIWFYVTSLLADGDFLVCVNSVAGPINPGTTCGTAARLCNKLDFSSPGTAINGFAFTPSCFNSPPVRPLWYKFTAGNNGPIEFAGFPTGFGGFRWAMYDITTGCPGIEVACNSFYDPFQPFGLSSTVTNCTSNPFCPPINVTAGSTYALMIDDTSQSNSGFDFNWTTNVKLLPTSEFSVDSLIGCGSLTVDFTNQSIFNTSTAYFLDYGDGSPTYAGNGSNFILPSHSYTPGTYLIQLTLNQPGACNHSFSRQIIVYPKPSSTFSILNDTLCLPSGSSINTNFNSTYISSTANYNWTFLNNSSNIVNSPGSNTVSWNASGIKPISLYISENGCISDTTRDTVYILNSPTSTFTLKDSACSDEEISILYTGNALATSNYSWNYGGANLTNVTNQSFDASWNLPGKKLLSLTVTENGCSSTLHQDSVIISQTPSVTINSFTRVCQGDTLTFNPMANGSTSVIYTWDFGTSTFVSGSIADASLGVFTWNTPGLTYWTATAVSPEGCKSNKDSISFTVYPKPDASFAVTKNKLCGVDTTILTFLGSASTSAIYNFSNGGSLVNGVLPNPLTLTFPGGPTTYPIFLSISDNLCLSDTTRDTLFVYPKPIADAGIDTALCSGAVISIGSPAILGQSYLWTPSKYLNNDTISNPQITVPYSGPNDSLATYFLTALSGVCSITDTVKVNIHPQQFAFFTPPVRQCLNENNFNFNPSSTIVNGAKFIWVFGANAVPDSGFASSVASVHFSTTGWQQITLTTQSNGCPSYTYLDSVLVKTSPVISLDADVYKGCPPLSVNFSNLSSTYPNSTFVWDFGDGTNSLQNNPSYVYNNAGTFQPTLTIITEDTCSTTDSLSQTIFIAPLPAGTFSATPSIVYDTYPFVSFSNQDIGIKCNYDFGDGDSDTLCNTLHAYADTGQYVVRLITANVNGCTDTSYQTIIVKSFYTLFIPTAFTPNDDGLNDQVSFPSNGIASFEIKIFNRFGQLVFSSISGNSSWNGNYLDTNTKCPDGVYIYTGKSLDVNRKKHSFTGKITLIR